TFLAGAQAGVADIGRENFKFPGRRNERLRRRHVEWKRIAQVIVSKRVADENRHGIGFLTAGTTSAPHAKSPIAAFLFFLQKLFEDGFLQEVELRTIAEKTRFVNGEIFEQKCELGFSFPAGEKAIVAIERIELAGFQTALETVFQEMGAAFIEEHA